MKRLNPDTGKPFEIGDPRPKSDILDGKVFGGYYTSLYKEMCSIHQKLSRLEYQT